jgi:hypothetical protein
MTVARSPTGRPNAADAQDGADDTRGLRGMDADFEKLTSHLKARRGRRCDFPNAQ